FFAYSGDVLHGAVVCGGVHETNVDGLDAFSDLFWAEVESGPKGFKHVCTARGGRGAASSVFCHFDTCSCDYKHAGSRDTKGVWVIASGTPHIYQCSRVGEGDMQTECSNHRGGRGDFADGLFFNA